MCCCGFFVPFSCVLVLSTWIGLFESSVCPFPVAVLCAYGLSAIISGGWITRWRTSFFCQLKRQILFAWLWSNKTPGIVQTITDLPLFWRFFTGYQKTERSRPNREFQHFFLSAFITPHVTHQRVSNNSVPTRQILPYFYTDFRYFNTPMLSEYLSTIRFPPAFISPCNSERANYARVYPSTSTLQWESPIGF